VNQNERVKDTAIVNIRSSVTDYILLNTNPRLPLSGNRFIRRAEDKMKYGEVERIIGRREGGKGKSTQRESNFCTISSVNNLIGAYSGSNGVCILYTVLEILSRLHDCD